MRTSWVILLTLRSCFLPFAFATDEVCPPPLSQVWRTYILDADRAVPGLGPNSERLGGVRHLSKEVAIAYRHSAHTVLAIQAAILRRAQLGGPLFDFAPVHFRGILGDVGLQARNAHEAADASALRFSRSWLSLNAESVPRLDGLSVSRRASGASQTVFFYPVSDALALQLFGRVGNREMVFRGVRHGTSDAAFGDLHPYLAARREFAASLLNESMGLDTVPRARRIRLNGEEGVVVEQAVGESGLVARMESRWDAEAFEFLIGNTDGHNAFGNLARANWVIDSDGRLIVRDHDRAFRTGLPIRLDPNERGRVGTYLPNNYSPRFATSLRRADFESWLRQRMAGHLDEFELRGILRRRDIILEDLALRPNAVWTPPAPPPPVDASRVVPNF